MTPPGALGGSARTPADIAAALRSTFLAEFQALQGRVPAQDAVLSTLFQALAVQIGRVYQEAEDVFPWQVLDDLMSGLGMPRPAALPAQTVVAFTGVDRRERISGEFALEGNSSQGERISFAPDASIELADTSLLFAAVAEGNRLQSIPGAMLPGGVPWPPSSTPCASASGAPALLLAFKSDAGHLSGLGVHLKTGALGSAIAVALARSPWILLDSDGVARDAGTLRSRIDRGGINHLDFVDLREQESANLDDDVHRAVDVGRGPFGEQVWILPSVPPERRWRGAPPLAFRDAVRGMLPDGLANALDEPLAWVYIPLPAGTSGVANALQGIVLNAVTASNLEVFEEPVKFERTGTVASFRPEGAGGRYVMGLLSVIGESGTRYVSESDLAAPSEAGRVRLRDDRIEMRPARRIGSRFDGYAKVRVLLCDGHRANGLEPGAIRTIRGKRSNVTAQVANVTTSRGGAAPPTYSSAKLRFAELLRTRERVVTVADFEVSARAYDPRIEQVTVRSISEVAEGALQAVDLVHAAVPRKHLADPDAERARLEYGLERHLEARTVIGRRVRVTVELTDA